MSDLEQVVGDELPDGWQIKPLGEFCDFMGGAQPPKSTFVYEPKEGYTRLLQIRDFEGDSKATYIPDSGRMRKIGADDISIARYGASVGRVLTGKEGAINVAIMTTFPDTSMVDKRFLFFALNHRNFYRYLTGLGGRAAQAGFNKGEVCRFRFPLPPLPEQKKIAQILSTVQRAIEAQERIIQITTELKKALMHKLFTEGLRNEPQKQSEIGPVPKSWEVMPLANLIRSNLQNGAFVQKPEAGKGFLFANVVDMYRETHLDLSRLERLDVPVDAINQYWLEDGDILVVRSSVKRDGIGQNCVARNLAESVFYDCHLIRVQTDPSKLHPEFLSTFWRSDIGRNDVILRSKTTTMTTINHQGISKALVPVAPIEEQSEIVNLLEIVDTKIRGHRAQKQHLEDLFRTLLHELMIAKTRVHELEITGSN